MAQLDFIRRLTSFGVLAGFLVYVFVRGLVWGRNHITLDITAGADLATKQPDFSSYVLSKTLGEDELRLGQGRRAIFLGDVHGQSLALEHILSKLNYDAKKDTLIHTGDMITKGTLGGSHAVLSFMAGNSIRGVRGNHDQKVIEWRSWIEWVSPMENGAGRRWLDSIENDIQAYAQAASEDEASVVDEWVDNAMAGKKDMRWWKLVPEGWKILKDHYRVARNMTLDQYDYLKSLPLVLHIPSEHLFVAHAGLLPYDLHRPILADGQPLAHPPAGEAFELAERRTAQERAVLSAIPQNQNPFILLNMRNVLHNHNVSKDTTHGKSWTGIWNTIVDKCSGFNAPSQEHDVSNDKWMPCEHMTVIYGHTASRGLDVHRWSIGLDSGCVYGRRLTALVVDSGHKHKSKSEDMLGLRADANNDDSKKDDEKASAEDEKAKKHETVMFGDEGEAKLVSVKCDKRREKHEIGVLPTGPPHSADRRQ